MIPFWVWWYPSLSFQYVKQHPQMTLKEWLDQEYICKREQRHLALEPGSMWREEKCWSVAGWHPPVRLSELAGAWGNCLLLRVRWEHSSGAYSLLSQVQTHTFKMTTGGRPNRNRWVGKDVCEYRWWRWHKPSCRGAWCTAKWCFMKLTFLAVAWAGNLPISTVKCVITLSDRYERVQERRTGLTVQC